MTTANSGGGGGRARGAHWVEVYTYPPRRVLSTAARLTEVEWRRYRDEATDFRDWRDDWEWTSYIVLSVQQVGPVRLEVSS